MKKLLYLSLIGFLFSINLSANEGLSLEKLKKIPLNLDFLSTENGGNKSAIDAYSDGIGIYTVGLEDKKFSAMNELVFKYGEEAKKSGETLKEHVLDKGNNKEQELATLLGTNTGGGSVIGGICDDGNPNTTGDVYIDTNGKCQGTEIVVRNSIKCENDPIGSEIIVDGISYLVVDNDSIRENLHRAETLCTSKVTEMYYLFYDADFIGNITKWDVSNVINMSNMFLNASFNQDISNWDVSNLVYANSMFENSLFNQDISNWNVSNIRTISGMFANTPFNQDISDWDLTNIRENSASGVFAFSDYNYPLPKVNFQEAGYYDGPGLREFIRGATSFNQDLSQYTISSCSYNSTQFIYDNFFFVYSYDMDILNYPERLPKIEFIECGSPGVY